MSPETSRVINEIRSKAATTFAEKLLPPIKLEIKDEATLDSARVADTEKGDFVQSANHYFTVLESADGPISRLEARLGLSQQLINLGRLGQAKKFLTHETLSVRQDFNTLNTRSSFYYSDRIQEKLGWICDLEGNYEESGGYFSSIINNLKTFVPPDSGFTTDEEKLYFTARHFLGRANFGLGNYDAAVINFRDHLANPNLNKDEQAYSHGFLARCFMKQGKLEMAAYETRKTRELFDEYIETHPERRSVLGHYFMLRGELFSRQGDFQKAREQFELAFTSHSPEKPYPRGEAMALFGIAGTYWAERNYGAAFKYAFIGIKKYPLSIVKPSI